MKFYDMHVNFSENVESVVEMAVEFGFSGAFIAVDVEKAKSVKNKIREMGKKNGFDAVLCVVFKDAKKARRACREIRKNYEVIAVEGGTPEANRMAVENRYVDVLFNPLVPWKRTFDHIMARLASSNEVAVELDLRRMIYMSREERVKLMKRYMDAVKLSKKYGFEIILTSSAIEKWDVRAPLDIAAFGRFLGMESEHAKRAVSDFLVKRNRERLSGRWIMPGVEVV